MGDPQPWDGEDLDAEVTAGNVNLGAINAAKAEADALANKVINTLNGFSFFVTQRFEDRIGELERENKRLKYELEKAKNPNELSAVFDDPCRQGDNMKEGPC